MLSQVQNFIKNLYTVKIKLDDNLINYLSNEEGVSIEGIPFSFILRNA